MTKGERPTGNSGKNSGRRGRVANLKPWPKGVCGNLSGRPESKLLSDAHKHMRAQPVPGDPEGRTWADLATERMIHAVVKGNLHAAQKAKPAGEWNSSPKTAGRPKCRAKNWFSASESPTV